METPVGSARTTIQHGGVVLPSAFDRFDPYCMLLGRTVSDGPRQVQPGHFDVVGVTRSVSIVAETDVPLPAVSLFGFECGDTPSHVYYKTRFHLRSEAQPCVCTLVCMINRPDMASPSARHLTLPEIRRTLGEVMRVEIPEGR